MTRLESLRAIYDAVKAGRIIDQNAVSFADDLELLWNCFPTATPPVSDAASHARFAWQGSTDAALGLLRAVLPGWRVSEISEAANPNDYPGLHWVCEISQRTGNASAEACADTPARASFLVILATLIAQELPTQGDTE